MLEATLKGPAELVHAVAEPSLAAVESLGVSEPSTVSGCGT